MVQTDAVRFAPRERGRGKNRVGLALSLAKSCQVRPTVTKRVEACFAAAAPVWTIVSVKPAFDPNHSFTDEQKEVQENFREAAAYAKSAQGEPVVYAQKADGTPQTPYNVAVADWFHALEILELDASAWDGEAGQVIRVKAVDDVQVTQVTGVITEFI